MHIFPNFALEMTTVGEAQGSLHCIFYRLEQALEDDLEYALAVTLPE